MFEVAPINTLLGSTTLEAAVVSLQPLTVAFEVPTVGQQPSTGGEGPTGWPLCPMVRGVVTATSRGDSRTYQWVLGSHDNKGYAFDNIVSSLESLCYFPRYWSYG